MTTLDILKQKIIYFQFYEKKAKCPKCSMTHYVKNETQVIECGCNNAFNFYKVANEIDLKLHTYISECQDEELLNRLLESAKNINRMNDKELKILSEKQDDDFIKNNPGFMEKLNTENKIWLDKIKNELENCTEPENQDLILNEISKIISNKKGV
jgi:hypothetical protein